MKFYSTNKKAKPADFKTALLRGLAPDGGLYMPNEVRQITNYQLPITNYQLPIFIKFFKNLLTSPTQN